MNKPSSLRSFLYTHAMFAPAPVFHLARVLGRALRFVGA
jgi:hypothetical protein